MELFNPRELSVYKWIEVLFTDLDDGKIVSRLTQIESPKIEVTSEKGEVLDATGSPIMDTYKAKKINITFENSFFSTDLAALQLGGEKKIASTLNKLVDTATEMSEIADDKVTLKRTPVGTIKYVYKLINRGIAETFTLSTGDSVEEGKFKINGSEITLPTGTEGILYVVYNYETDKAIQIDVKDDKYPKATGFIAQALFRNPCNENELIAGTIIARKAKIDASSISHDFTEGAKHGVSINVTKDYCDELNDTLLSYIITPE